MAEIWQDSMPAGDLSGARLHAVLQPAWAGEDPAGTVAAQLRSAGFTDAVVVIVEATLEDVFVNLVARQEQ